MKFLNLIIFLFICIFLFCDKSSNAGDSYDTLTGKWKLTTYIDLNNGKIENEPDTIQQSIILEFNDDSRNGTMEGHTVVNQVSGDYEIYSDMEMKVTSFGGTKIYEPYWGNIFWGAIKNANSFRLSNDEMHIFYNDDKNKMIFVSEKTD